MSQMKLWGKKIFCPKLRKTLLLYMRGTWEWPRQKKNFCPKI